jgi:WD40 repeat protein
MSSRSSRAQARDVVREARPSSAPPAPSSNPDEEGLSAYEIQRLRNIEANNKILEALDLVGAGRKLLGKSAATTAKPSQRGLNKRAKPEQTPTVPTRASSRLKNEPPDATTAMGLHEERADGSVVLGNGQVVLPENRGRSKFARRAPVALDGRLPIPCRRLNADSEDEDEEAEGEGEGEGEGGGGGASVKMETEAANNDDADSEDDTPLLHRLAAAGPPALKPDVHDRALVALVRAGIDAAAMADTKADTKKKKTPSLAGDLRLSDMMAVKVCKSAVVHLKFQPRGDGVRLLAGADKEGHVSLWHADRQEDHITDGVFLFKPHSQYVSGLAWHPHRSSHLLSASYDGSVRCLDVDAEHFSLLHCSDSHEYSAFSPAAAASDASPTLWLGTNTGSIGAIDPRAPSTGSSAAVAAMTCHEKKVNTLSFEPSNGWLLASSSTDCTVAVWDVRASLKKPLVRLQHPKSSQAAEWAPDGSARLLTTCMDDTLRVFSFGGRLGDLTRGGKPAAAAAAAASTPVRSIRHCTQTGRWVVPFRAVWTAAGDGIVCGGMKRTCEVFDAVSGKRMSSLSSEHMTAIPSRNAVHASGGAIACATNSGRVHLYEAA